MTFTGIVEEMGVVRSVEDREAMKNWDGSIGRGRIIVIGCSVSLGDCYVGCSIAVNGVCLTVTEFDAECFTAECAHETLVKSNLGDLIVGDKVNLERAAAANARISGHSVQGHVNECGEVLQMEPEGSSLRVRISASEECLMYIVPKCYIAVDGVSLTVCEVNYTEKWFDLMLIPHTQKCIILPLKKVGYRANLEVDIAGKYVVNACNERLAALERDVKLVKATGLVGLVIATAFFVKKTLC